MTDALTRYLRDRKHGSTWVPLWRYRARPVTLVALDCGHSRVLSRDYAFLGERDLEAVCHEGCPGMHYVTGTFTFPPYREGE